MYVFRDLVGAEAVVATARGPDAGAMLRALGAFATGRDGYLAAAGHALRAVGCDAPVLGAEIAARVPDPSLRSLGVEIVRVRGATPPGRRSAVGVLLVRAGLLMRMLDEARTHLEPRRSGGVPTLRHQLVKASFADAHGAAERVVAEAPHRLDAPRPVCDARAHASLGRATTEAAKLMGGHGFLQGSLHSLELLSLALAAIHAPGKDAA